MKRFASADVRVLATWPEQANIGYEFSGESHGCEGEGVGVALCPLCHTPRPACLNGGSQELHAMHNILQFYLMLECGV